MRILTLTSMFCYSVLALAQVDDNVAKPSFATGLSYKVEAEGSFSSEITPLWLQANKHGLSSFEGSNGYLRAGISRDLSVDEGHRWGIGFGVDLVGALNYTSKVVVQQAYVEGRWLHGVLTVGSKEQPMELKNNQLSSGSQTLGINARPVPQVRISLPEYWVIPYTNGWLRLKGHIAYGKMTDDNWQHTFTNQVHNYADDVLYHSKAGYLKIGNEDRFFPWSLELGLEMAATFGGTAYQRQGDGTMLPMKGQGGLKGMWNAFIPGGSDVGETTYQNVSGNQVGSWVARLNYDGDTWRWGLYIDKYFEDHSALFLMDYDGYGEGDEWQVKKKRRYLVYDFKDMLLGMELNFKYNRWIRDIVFEYMYTKYQSGPIYHDHTQTIADHIGGVDNYYNHYIYTGWQHWGQVIGNPLYRSPLYNNDGIIDVRNNRFMAFHLGISGTPSEAFKYRALATYQEGFGTYATPYTKKHHNVSFMLEGIYSFQKGLLRGFNVRGAYAMDFGHILGHNHGFQLTISKTGLFKNH